MLKQVHRKKLLLGLLVTLAIAIVAVTIIVFSNTGSANAPKPEAATTAPAPVDERRAEVTATLPLFHRLDANYARGAQPARGGIGMLERLGVKTVVDLRSVYDHTDDIGIAAERAGLRYYWMPMSVWNPPTDQEAKAFATLVSDESKGPFYVFCFDGLNRVGEMSAIYRLAHDKWSIKQALQEMDNLGFNPYYYSLRSYVWTYARKFHPQAVPPGARRLSPDEL
jgi:protein tyrosine phosphatase (PTP) superfamily phosphohydrolase (DUF442 family)